MLALLLQILITQPAPQLQPHPAGGAGGPPPQERGIQGDVPVELKKTAANSYDPMLPEPLRAAVTKASEAELDATRGPGNAMEILNAERALHSDVTSQQAIDLRKAATMLRSRFVHNTKVDEPTRYEQALSTYSKLDVTDPGLSAWIARAFEHKPGVAAQLGKDRKIEVAVLTRGSGMTRQAVFDAFKRSINSAGVHLEQAPLEKARFVIKIGADEAREEGSSTAVKVTLELERSDHGKPIWQSGYYRTTLGKNAGEAIKGSVEWLSRIAGRDLLFRWLSEAAFPNAVAAPPKPAAPGAMAGPSGSGQAPIRAGAQPGPPRVTLSPPGPPHP